MGSLHPNHRVTAETMRRWATEGENGRGMLLAWLTWNDRNGVYQDDAAASEGFEPLTSSEALELALDQIAG